MTVKDPEGLAREVEVLRASNAELRARLDETNAALQALRAGEVDAVVVGTEEERVYTLESADQPYRLLVERIPQAAATVSPDGSILFCNDRFASILGSPAGSLTGSSIVDFVTPHQRSQVQKMLEGAVDADVTADISLALGDGTQVAIFVSASIAREGARGACLVLTDLTEQRQYEKLRLTQEALRASEKALLDADRRKDEFLATLAHELRNPLAPIRNAVQILKAKAPDDPELLWMRDVLDRQVSLMARLLEDLMDVSRISRGSLALRREQITVADVLRAALETSLPGVEARGHELVIDIACEAMYIDADPVRLAQVFSNLINNAAAYSGEGSRISVATTRTASEAIVSVRDNGIGIAPEVLPGIFEMFRRGRPSTTRYRGGLGVGLSLVRRLVQLHGGTVEAHSEGPGMGSEFVVRLPLLPPGELRERAPVADERVLPKDMERRILVVDDNVDSAESLALILKHLGNEVATAYDGEAAVELARELKPDIMLLDIGMPKLDGYETCGRIRSEPWGSKVHLVALTGWGQPDDVRRTQDAGFDGHFVKPVNPAEVVAFLASLPVSEPNRAPTPVSVPSLEEQRQTAATPPD